MASRAVVLLLIATVAAIVAIGDAQSTIGASTAALTTLSKERLVLQTEHGDLHLAFYAKAAPKTVEHIKRCGELGLYNTNHFFRVDKGFVAQTADILGGRSAPMNKMQREVASRHVPLEVHADVKHDKRGILSMAKGDDPNSGGSSFSVLLGPAPHLNMAYTVFGEVTQGLEMLSKLEELPTRREGIFVMPLDRITILSTYMYIADSTPDASTGAGGGRQLCSEALGALQGRFDAQSGQMEKIRKERLPGR